MILIVRVEKGFDFPAREETRALPSRQRAVGNTDSEAQPQSETEVALILFGGAGDEAEVA